MKWVAGCPIKIRVVPRGRDTVGDTGGPDVGMGEWLSQH
jgi:hypothetical protein